MLKVASLQVNYDRVPVLKGVSLDIDAGEIVTIIGANGAGKSTLLKAIAGLVPIFGGQVVFQGRDISRLPAEKVARSGVSLVPEGKQIFSNFSVRMNLKMGAYWRLATRQIRGEDELQKQMDAVYELFPVLRERSNQLAVTLSGGERQMLAIGIALMAKPEILLLDEPSAGLSGRMTRILQDAMVAMRASGLTLLLVEQNANLALRTATRGYVLQNGEVTLSGTVEALSRDELVKSVYLGC